MSQFTLEGYCKIQPLNLLLLVIQLNGIVHSLVSISKQSSHSISESDDNLENINEDGEREQNDFLDEVDHEYERGGSKDAEDGPDWMFEG